MSKRDYYEVLGVERTATDQELKSAYRRLARSHHPDTNQNDPAAEEKFKDLSEAYRVLADPTQRQRYDHFGHAGESSGGGQPLGPRGVGGIEDILGARFRVKQDFGGADDGTVSRAAQAVAS